MTSHLVENYIDLLGGGKTAELVLMACAASLRLDDKKAATAINLVAATNGTTSDFVRRVKSLGCVSKQWDGTWYLLEDVRVPLVARFEAEVSEDIRARVRQELATASDRQLEEFQADGQLTEYRSRRVRFEAAYQRVLTPGSDAAAAASSFTEIWSALDGPARTATAQAVDYLAPEMERSARHLPPEILFLRGMAARARREHTQAREFFRQVWEQGRPGEIFAIAAHLFGTSTSDWTLGERALGDSIAWNHSAYHRAVVWHSLGVLLSKNPRRRKDAEEAFRKSLQLDNDPSSQAKTWHSLGNLFAKNRKRWDEAEDAYRKSLAAPNHHTHLGQVHASWADGLWKARGLAKAADVEKHALLSLELDPDNPKTAGVAHRVLGALYEAQDKPAEAIRELMALQETNRRLGTTRFRRELEDRLEKLRKRVR